MVSQVDYTKPASGKAFTADMRANFLAIYNEISALQTLNTGFEINLTQYLTTAQLADIRSGALTFDAGPIIQTAIDAATVLSSYGQARSVVNVRCPAGLYKIVTQVLVKTHVNLIMDGVLYNSLVSSTTPPIIFKAGSHCARFVLDCNNQCGVVFGEVGTTADMYVGDVRILNAGVSANQFGIRFLGTNITYLSISVDKGNIGVDFGDGGGVNNCNTVRGGFLRVFNSITGVRITGGCRDIHMSQVVLDSCQTLGAQIDSCFGLKMPDVDVFFNDTVGGACFNSGYAIKIGPTNAGFISSLFMNVTANNTGGIVMRLENIYGGGTIFLNGSRQTLPTGNAHNITQYLEYGSNILYDLFVVGNFDAGPVNVTGTITGGLKYWNTTQESWRHGINVPRVTIGSGGAQLGQIITYKPADTTLTSQTVLQNDADLLFSILANEVWAVTFFLDVGDLLLTTGIKLAISSPVAAFADLCCSVNPDIIGSANYGFRRSNALSSGVYQVAFPTANMAGVGGGHFALSFFIACGGAGGNVQLQWAQNTSSASALTVKATSYLIANRVV